MKNNLRKTLLEELERHVYQSRWQIWLPLPLLLALLITLPPLLTSDATPARPLVPTAVLLLDHTRERPGGLVATFVPQEPVAAAPTPPEPPDDALPEAAPPLLETPPPAAIPILMYHYVRTVDRTADPLGFQLSVTPAQLAAQLDWLARQGYTTVTMETAARCLQGEHLCPPGSIALTFDDGYADAYSAALPLLQQHGFVATFYIVSSFIGWPGYMDWSELADLHAAGMEIGAHTVHHRDLTTLSTESASAEIALSGQHLADGLQIEIHSFCYPAGKFNASVAALVREAGFMSATTTIQSHDQHDLYALPRLRIYGDLTQASFEALVQAYMP